MVGASRLEVSGATVNGALMGSKWLARLDQVRVLVRTLGPREAGVVVGLAILNRVFACQVFVCLACDAAVLPRAELVPDQRFRIDRPPKTTLETVSMNGDLDLSVAFVADASARGDECFVLLDGDRIASYCWFSARETRMIPGYSVRFAEVDRYAYKAFTHPDYRGRGLLGACLAEAMRHYARRGCRGFVTVIERGNVRSLKAFGRVGFRPVGHALTCRRLPKRRVWNSQGCQRFGLVVQRDAEHR
jgi:GNAT superfamily N-acetyltransferase